MEPNGYIWAASTSGNDPIDLALKLVSGVAGFVALIFTVYVVFLKRKWKKDEELARQKDENRKLEFEGLLTSFKADVDPRIQSTIQMVSSILEQLAKLEDAQGNQVGHNDLRTFKYNVDNDVAEIKRDINELKSDFKDFKQSCAQRHDSLASLGSLSDLKARVDELVRKVERLEDFRHQSADRYVLTVSYQQDVKLLTDAISVLRNDLRTVIEMVDKL